MNAPDPPTTHDDSSSMPKVGDTLGPYVIVGPVARGAMAAVFEARDPRTDETVALKVLHPLERTPDAQTRFRREFRHLSRLNHPNVLQVHEAGIHEQRLWYSMELIRGSDLKSEIETLETQPSEERYARADRGEISNFPGVSADYDVPTDPDLTLATDQLNIAECVDQIIELLKTRQFIG